MEKWELIEAFATSPENKIKLIGDRDFSKELIPHAFEGTDVEVLDSYYRYLSDKFFLFFNFSPSSGRFSFSPMFSITNKYPFIRFSNLSFPPLETYLLAYLISYPGLRQSNVNSVLNSKEGFLYIDSNLKYVTSSMEAVSDLILNAGLPVSPFATYPFSPDPGKRLEIATDMFDIFEDISTYELGMDYGIEPVVYSGNIPYLNRDRENMTKAQKSLTIMVRRALDRYLLFNYNTFGPYYFDNAFLMLPSTPTLWYYIGRRNEFIDMFEQSLLIPYQGDMYPQYKGKKTYLEVLYIYMRDITYIVDLLGITNLFLLDHGDERTKSLLSYRFKNFGPEVLQRKEEILNLPVFLPWLGTNPEKMDSKNGWVDK